MKNNIQLANQVYDWLLDNYDNNLQEINWVRNLSYIDSAITVISIWLKENDIANFDEFLEKYNS